MTRFGPSASRRMLAVVVAVTMVLSGCGRGSQADKVDSARIDDLAAKRGLEPRTFRWSSTVAGRTVAVDGLVEDDYRYQGKVLVDGALAWEEVVVDDVRYLRVADITRLVEPELVTELAGTGPAGAALVTGQWIMDPRGAPGEFAAAAQQIPLDPQLVLGAARRLDRIADLVRLGGFAEYNTLAVSYLPKNDKFPEHKKDGTRFDHVPAAFDPNRVYSKLDDARTFIQFASVWMTLEGTNRIEELIEMPNPDDDRYNELYEQLGRAGSRRLQVLLGAIKAEPDAKRLRQMTETYRVRPRPSATVEVPSGATEGDLVGLVASLRTRIGVRPDPSALFGPLN